MKEYNLDPFTVTAERSNSGVNCWTFVAKTCGLVDNESDAYGQDGNLPSLSSVSHFFTEDPNGKFLFVLDRNDIIQHAAIVRRFGKVRERKSVGEDIRTVSMKESLQEYDPDTSIGRRMGYKSQRFRFIG